MAPKIVTIGVYGFDKEGFFGALAGAGVDTFCDLRRRRGVRGAQYAFANSKRLRAELERLGVRYFHFLELAPSNRVRERQKQADKAAGAAKRSRERLGEAFVAGYTEECLRGFDPAAFIEGLGPEAKTAALFCVEREPEACHRSLVAERLRQELGVVVEHLRP